MKPVYQKILHNPETPHIRGDCFRACIASIFELELEEVPHFMQIKHDKGSNAQILEMLTWLKERGCGHFTYSLNPERDEYLTLRLNTHYIASGPSPRGTAEHPVVHAVVAYNGVIVHDPHPDQTGLIKMEWIELFPQDPGIRYVSGYGGGYIRSRIGL